MTIDDFRGQVRISKIQEAFDEVVNNINNMIDTYNLANSYEDVDYTKGGTGLSAPSYSLSVGGLKTVLTNYNNTLVGCNVFKINNTTCLVTDGLFITSSRVYRIKDTFVNGNSGWDMSELYYDIDNDNVIYKQGSHGVIVDSQDTYSQPTINSNTDYGVFTAGNDSQDAYKCTNSEGWTGKISSGRLVYEEGVTGENVLTWELPAAIDCTTIQYNMEQIIFVAGNGVTNATVDLYVDGEKLSTPWGQHTITVNKKINKIQLIAKYTNIHTFVYKLSNLVVGGTSSSIAIQQGGLIIPSPNIIKICDLNWNSKDGLIKDVKALQIEKPKNYSLTTTNKGVLAEANMYNLDTLNTTNSGKFVAYSDIAATGNMNHYGFVSILGENIIDNSETGDPMPRTSNTAFAMTKLYIPKGCSDGLSSNNTWFTGEGRTITDPIFKYNE